MTRLNAEADGIVRMGEDSALARRKMAEIQRVSVVLDVSVDHFGGPAWRHSLINGKMHMLIYMYSARTLFALSISPEHFLY